MLALSNALIKAHLVLFLVSYREHDDRKARVNLNDPAACFHASNPRHIDVKQHGIVVDHAQTHQSLFSIASLADHETQCAQGLEETLSNSCIVLDDKHLASVFHAYFSFAMRGSVRKNVVPVCWSLFTHARPW